MPGTAGKGKKMRLQNLREAEKWRFWWIMKSPCRTWKKWRQQKGYGFLVKEKKEKEYHVEFTVSETEPAETEEKNRMPRTGGKENKTRRSFCRPYGRRSQELGKILMKSFLYALTQQDELPDTILCYNGGAKLTCEGSESLEDLKDLAARGVEILDLCGTCLNFYGITEKLQVGSVTNMYASSGAFRFRYGSTTKVYWLRSPLAIRQLRCNRRW